MKHLYECEYCSEHFSTELGCKLHEMSHLNDIDGLKYCIRHVIGKDMCLYCINAYYVYGCELDCKHKDCGQANNYKYFEPKALNERDED